MKTQADKSPDNKNKATAHSFSEPQNSSESAFEFVDNRPAAITQRKFQAIADNRPQAKQAAQLQTIADNYSAPQPVQKKENNTGLPDNLKAGIENLSGYSLNDVNVHYNSSKPSQLRAHAYAQGTDIHLASGQEKHLPHEAWHVVQQKQGRVRPTIQMRNEVSINDDKGLEQEADIMGRQASVMGTKSQCHETHESIANTSSNTILQKKKSPANAPKQSDVIQCVYEPKDYEDAVERHLGNREYLGGIITNGLKLQNSENEYENRFYNSCEWIVNQTGSSPISIYSLTPTHDYKKRSEGEGDAYFGMNINDPTVGRLFPPSKDIGLYDKGEIVEKQEDMGELGVMTSISYTGKDQHLNIFPVTDAAGFHYDKGIALCDPLDSDEKNIKIKLVHEMQHHADLHERTTDYAKGSEKTKGFERYKSEVRAYTLSQEQLGQLTAKYKGTSLPKGNEVKLLNTMKINSEIPNLTEHAWNPAQLVTFGLLYHAYPYVKKHWDAESKDTLESRLFQNNVAAFKVLTSPNKLNSRRVHEFYNASWKLLIPKGLDKKKVDELFNTISQEFFGEEPLSAPEANEILTSDVWGGIKSQADDYIMFSNVQTDAVNKLHQHLLKCLK